MAAEQRFIYQQLEKIQAGMAEGIPKDRKNKQQGFNYRSIDDVYGVLHPLLVDHSVLMLPEIVSHELSEFTTTKGTRMIHAIVKMRLRFVCAIDGSEADVFMYGEASDSLDKATAKAQSVAYREGVFKTFCVPTGEDPDGDPKADRSGASRRVTGAREQSLSQQQRLRIWEAAKERAAFLKLGGEEEASQIMRSVYEELGYRTTNDVTPDSLQNVLDAIGVWTPEKDTKNEG